MVEYKGGFVREPKAGIYKNLIVLDFKNLYPSIIITHNIDVKTMNCKHKECKKNKVPGFDRWFCTKEDGKIPKKEKKILKDRDEAIKKLKKDPKNEKLKKRIASLKLAANITYGYFGYKGSPYYNIKAAESISAFGRFYIQEVIREAEKNKFKVLYADTDSVFLTDSGKKAKSFLNKINKKLPGVIKLEFQGLYKKGLFVSRKTGKGAKKKYALIDSKNNLLVRGFETRREDWCSLAKNTQEKILKLVLLGKKDEAVKYAKRTINNLKKGKVKKSELIITEQITKPLNEYKAIGPHTEAAKKLQKHGHEIKSGTYVKYFISKGEGSISKRSEPENSKKEADYNYYIKNQVIPAILRVLSDFGVNEGQLMGQKTLVNK